MLQQSTKKYIYFTMEVLFIALIVYIVYLYTITCRSTLFLEYNTNITNCVKYNVISSDGNTRILGEYNGPSKNYKGHLVIEFTCNYSDIEKMKSNATFYLKSEVNINNPQKMNVSLIRTWNELLKGDRIDATIFVQLRNMNVSSIKYIPQKVDEETY